MKKTSLWERSFIKIWSSKTFRIMRCSLIILLISATCAIANDSYSQSARVSLDMKNVAVKEVLNEIEKTSEFYFLYSSKLIDVDRKVNIHADNQAIKDILDGLFANSDVDYVLIDRQIVLSPGEFISRAKTKLQPITVTGRVMDENENPMPGVSIVIKGTTKATMTNIEGEYTIEIDDASAVLVFSYVGYVTKEIAVGDQTVINVSMDIDVIGLGDVVVIGYGQEKKVNLTGSVSNIRNENLENKAITNIVTGISGQMSGITILESSGKPGKDIPAIRIRGLGTFSNAGNSPLIIIDGMPGNINMINPDDVKSISILKDAASAAIYGARAANGVILVQTKAGEQIELQVNYNNYIGWQVATEIPNYVDSWIYATAYNESLTNMGKAPLYTEEDIQKFREGDCSTEYPNCNHLKNLINSGSGFQQKHYLSFNGGQGEKTQYLFSFGYTGHEGIVQENFHNRYDMRLNLNSKLIEERLNLNINLFGNRGFQEEPVPPGGDTPQTGSNVESIFMHATRLPTNIPGRKKDGTYGYIAWIMPEADLDSKSFRAEDYYYFQGRVQLELNITNFLKIIGSTGYKFHNNFTKIFNATFVLNEATNKIAHPGQLREQLNRNHILNHEALIVFDNTTAGGHSFHLLGGYSQEDYQGYWFNTQRKNFPSNDLTVLNAGSEENMVNNGSGGEWALRSFFGRFKYSYNGKYLLEANVRYDGSSRFAEDNRYGLFPSFSGAWRISEEPFFLDQFDWINNLKLRASWGELGNQQISNYPYQSVISLEQDYPIGGTLKPGAAIRHSGNVDITWESTRVIDVGLDLSIFNGKLSLVADYFNKKTSDILYNISASDVFGMSPSEQNYGEVLNTGFEFELIHKNTFGDFSYNISPVVSIVHNEVLELYRVKEDIGKGLFVGEPLNAIYGYVADGLFVDQNDIDNYAEQLYDPVPGDIRYKDISGPDGTPDGRVSPEYDRKVIGSTIPKYNFGLNLFARYKNFDMSLQLTGIAGVEAMLGGDLVWAFRWGYTSLQQWQWENRWTAENPDRNASYPRLRQIPGSGGVNEWTSSYWVKDASFLKIKDLQIGYTLPDAAVKWLKINQLRVFFSGRNLHTFDHFYEGWDPEMLGHGQFFYPITSVYTFGINVNF